MENQPPPESFENWANNYTSQNNEPVFATELAVPQAKYNYFPWLNSRLASWIIMITAIVFSFTSINNEYALDDGIVIHQNEFVLVGAKGIKDIMTHDLFHSFYRHMNAKDQLRGGRYAPLPVITYALEQEMIGTYRTGMYEFVADVNNNGTLDKNAVGIKDGMMKEQYEFNAFVDLNKDGKVQSEECIRCWDANKNFNNEPNEDCNNDGVFNEIDCQVKGAYIRHLSNICLYAICCYFFYRLLSRYLLRSKPDLSFLAAFIFTIHPVHSEVFANIKGREDILSLLFICLTFIFMFRYYQQRHYANLLLGNLFYLLGLLCGEYSLLLLLFAPLATYFFSQNKFTVRPLIIPVSLFVMLVFVFVGITQSTTKFLIPPMLIALAVFLLGACILFFVSLGEFKNRAPNAFYITMLGVVLAYLLLRFNATGLGPEKEDTEILNNPFLFATESQAVATKMVVLLRYLKLFFFPHPLISDYSYATFAYPSIDDTETIVSFTVYAILSILALFLCIRRHILGFALAVYLVFIISVSNFFIFSRMVMHEGYLYHAGIGLCIALAWLILKLFGIMRKIPSALRGSLTAALLLAIAVPAFLKTMERCLDWKNDITIFFKDVNYAPNSVIVLGNAGARWIDLADTKEIAGLEIPGSSGKTTDYNGLLNITDHELKTSVFKTKREIALYKGIAYLKRAVSLHPKYVNGYLNLGLAYYKLRNDVECMANWKKAEALYPKNPYLQNYYAVYSENLRTRGMQALEEGNNSAAIMAFRHWTKLEPDNSNAWYNLSGAWFNSGYFEESLNAIAKAMEIEPGNPDYKTLESLTLKALNLETVTSNP